MNVTLVLATSKGAVLVPSQATQISQQGPYVYVVKPNDTVELRLITQGQRQGDDVVVTKGVADGERVVVTGQLTLMPGAKVHVQEAGAAPGGASGATSLDPTSKTSDPATKTSDPAPPRKSSESSNSSNSGKGKS